MHLTSTAPATEGGVPIVFLHGMTSSGARDWPAQHWADICVRGGRPAHVFDLPAHGNSAEVTAPDAVSIEKIVDHVIALADDAGGTIDLVGYSLGARLAWACAARHPAKIRRLVLGGISTRDPLAVVDYEAAHQFIDTGVTPADPVTARISGLVAGTDMPHSVLHMMQGIGVDRFDPQAESPKGETLFVAGEADPMCTQIEDLCALVPDSQLVRVPGDHQSALRAPEFQQAALRFLSVQA
ncbi:alpha/beta fold hydrolase [Cognatishimia sp. SS12]|uniref:alpha/beta fold hydrolase n=1 Tax=Cognatishimia sp. SS12 TaxID=2979465 RepID=UPI00232FFFFB|nr:alpha/beta hydrolase [Cognatishimia sp. SS12]MDC0739377.1 alpha/beta fold hydrolase [Cognatishimia sp. SS12]